MVMRRVRVMTEEEFEAVDLQAWASGQYVIPCELKSDSFGWLDGRIVAIDYGN